MTSNLTKFRQRSKKDFPQKKPRRRFERIDGRIVISWESQLPPKTNINWKAEGF